MQVEIEVGRPCESAGDDYTRPHWTCHGCVLIRVPGRQSVSLGLAWHQADTAEEARAKATAAAQATLRELCEAVAEVCK